jgi:hypothetical protein
VGHYEVLRGVSEADLELVATVAAGSDGWVDADLPSGATSLIYRVDALDLDNTAMGTLVPVSVLDTRVLFADADGNAVYIIVLDGHTTVGFNDFIAFAGSFNSLKGESGYIIQADTDGDGTVGFTDFIAFAGSFNKTAATQNGEPIPAAKPIVAPGKPGVNENAELSLNLGSDRVLVGQTVSVDVSVANVRALQGYGFVLTYDPSKFELVEAAPAQNDLLKSAGGETPLFLQEAEAGRVTVANAIVDGGTVSGGGTIATLTFRVLNEFEDNSRFEIAQGLVFDPNQLSNPVVALGTLNVESTPTDFALFQNYPNPFNPETTIKYNLAEGADVQLRIYNIVGQVVRALVAERQSAGRYQVRWNGTDDRGASVSSGIYFYHLSAGKFQDQRRLMLLK